VHRIEHDGKDYGPADGDKKRPEYLKGKVAEEQYQRYE